MTFQRFPRLLSSACGFLLLAGVALDAAEPVPPMTPRALRIAERTAERIYARQAIAEARAARAEARAAEIAKVVPEPPPPRPATLRRMARAGVPMGAPPQAVIVTQEPPVTRSLAPSAEPPAVVRKVTPSPQPKSEAVTDTASRTPVVQPAPGVWTLDPDPASSPVIDSDGTRSVLATGGESPPPPAAPSTDADRPGPAVTQPPIELLPTPSAE